MPPPSPPAVLFVNVLPVTVIVLSKKLKRAPPLPPALLPVKVLPVTVTVPWKFSMAPRRSSGSVASEGAAGHRHRALEVLDGPPLRAVLLEKVLLVTVSCLVLSMAPLAPMAVLLEKVLLDTVTVPVKDAATEV